MSNRYHVMGCPKCGKDKTPSTHTYGVYRVYFNGDILKLKCKTCDKILRFRIIRGGV